MFYQASHHSIHRNAIALYFISISFHASSIVLFADVRIHRSCLGSMSLLEECVLLVHSANLASWVSGRMTSSNSIVVGDYYLRGTCSTDCLDALYDLVRLKIAQLISSMFWHWVITIISQFWKAIWSRLDIINFLILDYETIHDRSLWLPLLITWCPILLTPLIILYTKVTIISELVITCILQYIDLVLQNRDLLHKMFGLCLLLYSSPLLLLQKLVL